MCYYIITARDKSPAERKEVTTMKNPYITEKTYYVWATDPAGWPVKEELYNVLKVEGTENGKLVVTVEKTDPDGWPVYEVEENVWEA